MKVREYLGYNDLIGHHTLLYGDTNTRKTFYTAKFIQYLLEIKKIDPKDITILDFAPKLSYIDDIKIGGKIEDFYDKSVKCNNINFEGEIIPPRLNATSKKELYENACHNFKLTSKILNEFNENPTSILIINDISIYLHFGNKKYFLDSIKQVTTFFGNSYYGSSIKKSFSNLFSIKEKNIINYLIKNIEKSYFTDIFNLFI